MEAPKSWMETMVALANELRAALGSRTLSVAELEGRVEALPDKLFQGWDAKIGIAPKGPDPLSLLVLAVLHERAGRCAGESPRMLALLAMSTAEAFANVDQLALARQAQARAIDVTAGVQDPVERDRIMSALAITATEIARRAEDFDGAVEAFRDLYGLLESAEDEPVLWLSLRSSEALLCHRHKRLEEAVEISFQCAATADRVEALLSTGAIPEAEAGMARSALSKYLNGFANALLAAADEHVANAGADARGELLRRVVPLPPALRDPTGGSNLGDPLHAADTLAIAVREHSLGLFDRAIGHAEANRAFEFLGTQHFNAGLLLSQLGRVSEALARVVTASQYAQRIPGHPMLADITAYLAAEAAQRGDWPAALTHWRSVVAEEMRRVLEHGGRVDPAREAGIINQILATAWRGADLYEAALLVESLKGLPLATTIARGLPRLAADAGLAGDFATLHSQREALRRAVATGSDRPMELDAVERELERVQGELAVRSPEVRRWVDALGVQPSRVDQLLAALDRLGPGTLLLGVEGATGGQVWVYALTSEGAELALVPGPRRDARPEELAAALLAPVASSLEALTPPQRLIFTGPQMLPLSRLPFEGRPLCERATISVVRSLGVLLALQQSDSPPLNSAVFLGDPAREGERLRWAREEALQLAQLYAPCGVALQAEDATVENLKAHAQADIIHFATHATVAGENGRRWATLWLAPSDAGDSGELSEDRIAREIHLRTGAFVNLATCTSAAQHRRQGFVDGGLVNAFLAAGAGSVLATTAALDDRLAGSFQLAFYAHLESGASPAQSLAETQRACLAGTHGPELSDPMVWSAFQLYGV